MRFLKSVVSSKEAINASQLGRKGTARTKESLVNTLVIGTLEVSCLKFDAVSTSLDPIVAQVPSGTEHYSDEARNEACMPALDTTHTWRARAERKHTHVDIDNVSHHVRPATANPNQS